MEGLQLTDEQLKDYQTRFITMYTDTNKATRDLVTAAEAKDAQAAQQAFNALQTATSQEGPLVNEVNSYCEAQPSPGVETISPSVSPSPSPTQP
jgi:protein-disulfide isomerase-like protein with CxxC motif